MTERQQDDRDSSLLPADDAAVTVSLAGAETVSPRNLLQEVNAQLLIAGLREHELADELRRQLAFSNAVTNSIGDGLCAYDQTGRITFVNPAASQLLGWPVVELLGRDIHATVDLRNNRSTGLATAESPLLTVLQSGTHYQAAHALLRRSDDTRLPVAYSTAPIVIDDQVVGAVVTFRDITEVLRLQQLHEEYLALVTHDLRAPLSVIMGHADLLSRRGPRNMEGKTSGAEAIVKNAQRMNRMLQDVLDRSRLEAGREALDLAPVDLVQLFKESVDHSIPLDQQGRLVVEDAAHLPVIADAALIERVIVNLLSNAFKYSSPASPVVVRVFNAGPDAAISVADQGVGITADDLAHVFEKHFRAGTAGTTAGTGLGLYSSRLIVEAHGGQIWAQSEVGQGSTFTFSLLAGGS